MLRLCVLVALAGTAYADKAVFEPAQAPVLRHVPPPAPPVTPPLEVTQLAKQIAGTYACKGVMFVGNGASQPLTAKLAIKTALGGAWLASSLQSDSFSVDDYRTFDTIGKQWTRIQMTSTIAHAVSTSLGDKSGAWTWEGTQSSPSGTMQVRDHEELGKGQLKLWGEALLGGSWQKSYELTCKR
jgi:hypothetical protein